MTSNFTADGSVTSAVPATRPAVILTAAAEANGRPVSYVLPAEGDLPTDGKWVELDRALLRRTMNAKLLQSRLAYLTLYTSTPVLHQQVLREIAAAARDKKRGVWARDETAEFRLADQDSIGPAGVLILPKMFRRCSDYLKAMAAGFQGTIDDWLVGVSATGRRPEDDKLLDLRAHRSHPQRRRAATQSANPVQRRPARHRLRREVGLSRSRPFRASRLSEPPFTEGAVRRAPYGGAPAWWRGCCTKRSHPAGARRLRHGSELHRV